MSKATELIEKYKVDERDDPKTFASDFSKDKTKINSNIKTITQLWKKTEKQLEKNLKQSPPRGLGIGIEFRANTRELGQKLNEVVDYIKQLDRVVN